MKIVERGSNYTVVEVSPDVQVLFSYNAPVAAHVSGLGYVRTDRHFSSTTSRHINKWLRGAQAKTVPHVEFEKMAGEGGY